MTIVLSLVQVLVKSSESGDMYYKEPELSKENFTPDGWFRTGDIGTFLPEWGTEILALIGVMNEIGQIKLIDRRKHMTKMAQGEWISPTLIENSCLACPFIEQVPLMGS